MKNALFPRTHEVTSLIEEFVYPRDGYMRIAERMAESEARLQGELIAAQSAAQPDQAKIAAITKVDHRNIGTGKMGARTAEVKKFFLEVVHGNNPKYRNWCYPIYEKAPGLKTQRQDAVPVK